MANVPPTFKHTLPPKDPISVSNWKSLRQVYEQVAKVINGKLSLGQTASQTSGTSVSADNIDAVSVMATVTVAANTDFALTHNLNRLPSGYLVVSKTVTGDIYNGVTAWSTTQIFLRSSTALAGSVIKVLIW